MHLDLPELHQERHRDRDSVPVVTDSAEKMVAVKWKEARCVSPTTNARLHTNRCPIPARATLVLPQRLPASAQVPHVRIDGTEPDPGKFSRVLNISPSQQPVHAHAHATSAKHASKLFNPNTNPVPMRRTAEPEAMSDSAGSSHPPQAPAESSRQCDASQPRQLFDHRKQDPVSFSVAQAWKPVSTPKSPGDYTPASSTPSLADGSAIVPRKSSTAGRLGPVPGIGKPFNKKGISPGPRPPLSSYHVTPPQAGHALPTGSLHATPAPSLFWEHKQPREESKSTFSTQLKRLYRDISALETKILTNPGEPADDSRIVIKGGSVTGSEDVEKAHWKKAIEDHKMLADMMLNLLEISQAPGVPVSLCNIPEKYNIITRLWTNGFHRLLENLHRSSLGSKIAMEHLQEFIYYAYTFYTALLKREPLLGNLARYCMAIAAMIPAPAQPSSTLTVAAINSALHASPVGSNASPMGGSNINSEKLPGRGDSQSPSVGIVAAQLMVLEPEER
ncbi:hypothetical protein BC834DRAFT_975458 [Gloeopeniophorella convolvens]|nr:hypothetical protein BC834DRAFT_975458 [Gloeopeniophorella convolvens]